ncbi:MAG: NADH-quinone oxidoreductase subunit NuoF [Desulfobacterales bacterium]|jgi:NADH-quinone oxidoreductase subunit F
MELPMTGSFRSDGQPLTLKEYEAAGGYQALHKVLHKLTPEEVIQIVKDSKLRGRGGAGFPTGQKWSFMPRDDNASAVKYLTCNADEMEPGTFKDRFLMENSPHQLIEGIAIASYAIGAETAYIFVRGLYRKAVERLAKAVNEARTHNYLGKNILGSHMNLDLHVHSSAGRYICGEASAMLNALEGRRPIPRHKPPHMSTEGFFGKPTVVNNVETLFSVPPILAHGPQWYLSLGQSAEGGTKIYCVSGKVKNPGVWELPIGITIREVIEQYAGGMREGVKLRAVIPGGASSGFVLEKELDTPLDIASLDKVGSRLGTGTLIVLDDQTCPVAMVLNLQQFYADQSCGWCTPCRQGLPWVVELLRTIEEGHAKREDLNLLPELIETMAPGHTFCDLASGAMEPLVSALKHFRDDFEQHIDRQQCPWR